MESAAARKPARPKRRQEAEKAGVERRQQNVARREVVAKEKTFGELGMASANSPAAAAWVGTMMTVCGPKEALGLLAAKGVHMTRLGDGGEEDSLSLKPLMPSHQLSIIRVSQHALHAIFAGNYGKTLSIASGASLPLIFQGDSECERLQRTDMVVTTCRLPLRVVVIIVSAVMAAHTGWRELAAYLSLARPQLGWSLAWLGHVGKWLSSLDGRVSGEEFEDDNFSKVEFMDYFEF
uniref:Uncharacterized protein n=1 Tax=Oryza glaberrima TaxID=4538 RepID=I1QI04_ORYGL